MRSGPHALQLASAGVGVVGVTYGMARYGYGLLLPDIRRDFGLGPGLLGAIATGAYGSYLLATAFTGSFAARIGPRFTAAVAATIAAVGMVAAALAPSPELFAVAILVAGAGAGFAFAPFSDVAKDLQATPRGRVLSAVNCGTGFGVALAAPIAILAGSAWRVAWLAFAGVAVIAAAWAWRVMPPRTGASRAGTGWRAAGDRQVRPMVAACILIGLGSAAFWTFAVEHLVTSGGASQGVSRAFLGVVGVASVLAIATSDLMRRLGTRRAFLLLTGAEAAAVAVLAFAASSTVAVFLAAVVFGAAYNGAVGITAIWSTALFADRPSLGISVAMSANGVGLMAGPLTAGLLTGAIGLAGALLLGAALVALAGVFAPRTALLADPPPRAEALPPAVTASSSASRRRGSHRLTSSSG